MYFNSHKKKESCSDDRIKLSLASQVMLSTRGLSDSFDFLKDDKLTDSRLWSFELAQI